MIMPPSRTTWAEEGVIMRCAKTATFLKTSPALAQG
jgi:hypothetical protein